MLIIEDLTFGFSEALLSPISVKFDGGAFVGITGHSGLGKSTFLEVISGLRRPIVGDVKFNGESIYSNVSGFHEQVAFVSQSPFLLSGSLEDNVTLGRAYDADLYEAMVEALGIEDLQNLGTDITRVSGGQRQRVAMMRALLKKPRILFLDESTSALDTKMQSICLRFLSTLPFVDLIFLISHRDECRQYFTEEFCLEQFKVT